MENIWLGKAINEVVASVGDFERGVGGTGWELRGMIIRLAQAEQTARLADAQERTADEMKRIADILDKGYS